MIFPADFFISVAEFTNETTSSIQLRNCSAGSTNCSAGFLMQATLPRNQLASDKTWWSNNQSKLIDYRSDPLGNFTRYAPAVELVRRPAAGSSHPARRGWEKSLAGQEPRTHARDEPKSPPPRPWILRDWAIPCRRASRQGSCAKVRRRRSGLLERRSGFTMHPISPKSENASFSNADYRFRSRTSFSVQKACFQCTIVAEKKQCEVL